MSLTDITHRDKSLAGFSIYCLWQLCATSNSICLRLDMLLHSSPKARYVKSERALSHIELEQSDNISTSSKARTYRVGEAHISTKEKNKSKNRRIFSFYSCSFFCLWSFRWRESEVALQWSLYYVQVKLSLPLTSPSGETSLTKWTSLSEITSLAQRANLVLACSPLRTSR